MLFHSFQNLSLAEQRLRREISARLFFVIDNDFSLIKYTNEE